MLKQQFLFVFLILLAPFFGAFADEPPRPILNSQMQSLLGKRWVNGVGGFGNCHGATAYFAGLTPFLGHREAFDTRFLNCQRIPFAETRRGDIGLIMMDEEFVSHSFLVLDKNYAFTKNGTNGGVSNYEVMEMQYIADIYYTISSSDETGSTTINFYRDDLEKNNVLNEKVDCLQGPPSDIEKCAVDLGHPFAIYMRCARPYYDNQEWIRKNLSGSSFEEIQRRLFLLIKKSKVDGDFFLKSNPSALQEVQLIENLLQQELAKIEVETEIEKAWQQLASIADDLSQMIDPQAQVRKVIFSQTQ